MKTKLCTVAALGMVLVVASHGQETIDTFDTPQYVSVPGSPGATNWNSEEALEVPGAERDLRVHRVGPGLGSLSGDVGYSFPNTVSLACGFGVIGSLHLVYDGPDTSDAINHTGLGGIDLTSGGTNNAIKFATASDLGAEITVTVYQDATRYSTVSIPVAADPSFTFVDTVIGFTQFAAAGPDGGADFSQVGAIEFEIGDGPEGADISLRIIGLVRDPQFDPPPPPPTDPCYKPCGSDYDKYCYSGSGWNCYDRDTSCWGGSSWGGSSWGGSSWGGSSWGGSSWGGSSCGGSSWGGSSRGGSSWGGSSWGGTKYGSFGW